MRKETTKQAVHRRVVVEPLYRADGEQAIVCADGPGDTIRLAGERFTISGSGRIRMA